MKSRMKAEVHYWHDHTGKTLLKVPVMAWFTVNEKEPTLTVALDDEGAQPRKCVDVNLADILKELKTLGLIK